MSEENGRSIKSIENAFEIIEAVREADGIRLNELSEVVEKSPSTLHQYLQTLLQSEFLVKVGHEYHLSYRFLDYGEYARQRNPLFEITSKKVVQLADNTGERAQFVVPEHQQVVVLNTVVGDQAVKAGVRTGQRFPMHATAAGKAMLAHYPPARVKEIIEARGLTEITEHTITDEEELFDVLEEVRESGVAFNNQEDTSGLRAIGCAIRDADGLPVGALSVSGPSHRLEQAEFEQELIDRLKSTTNEIELRFRYD
ncbi:IclR family transcriptional regulator [Salinigranum halophilum]|uniref:IclR family transcriptional regulator n=1 Tax=Salinigranum halophilum TaxID=2565931 RepID=UPI0010A9167B|nr:IclR family transcriptional regulator [Salinigranum halophilum]